MVTVNDGSWLGIKTLVWFFGDNTWGKKRDRAPAGDEGPGMVLKPGIE